MDFTREPIIETVITPREGCKLVVRSSKGPGQEEYFVDALEVVSFGNSFFFRSLERPKSFIVPTSDYEVLEVREARMVLKNVGTERTIKIAGGREPHHRHKEPQHQPAAKAEEPKPAAAAASTTEKDATKVDKKRDRRRNYRKRRGRTREEGAVDGEQEEHVDLPAPEVPEDERLEDLQSATSYVSTLLPPPPTLISESLQRYKRMEFFPEPEEALSDEVEDQELVETETIATEETYDSFDDDVDTDEATVEPEEQKQD